MFISRYIRENVKVIDEKKKAILHRGEKSAISICVIHLSSLPQKTQKKLTFSAKVIQNSRVTSRKIRSSSSDRIETTRSIAAEAACNPLRRTSDSISRKTAGRTICLVNHGYTSCRADVSIGLFILPLVASASAAAIIVSTPHRRDSRSLLCNTNPAGSSRKGAARTLHFRYIPIIGTYVGQRREGKR